MRERIGVILGGLGVIIIYKDKWMQIENMQIIKQLLQNYWPYLLIIIGMILLLPNQKKS